MTTKQTAYEKMQKASPWMVGDKVEVVRRPDHGEMGWQWVESTHKDDKNDPEEYNWDNLNLIGRPCTIRAIDKGQIWVSLDDDKEGHYWDVPFFVLIVSPIVIRFDGRQTVEFNREHIQIGCVEISHEVVKRIYDRCFPAEG
jgi:hypothetical protein